MDIVAGWSGSVDDTTIFNDSNVRVHFLNGNFLHIVLLVMEGIPVELNY